MKNDLYLKLNGEIAPLTSNEENQLKGGFGSIEILDVKTRLGATNRNCQAGGWFDSNDNCNGCGCGSSPSTGVTPACL